MAQITTGIRSILSRPRVYNFFQRFIVDVSSREELINDYIKARPGDRILDIGCGTGNILRHLPQGVSYVGFDIDRKYIEHARAAFKDRGQFYVGAPEKWVTEWAGSFDIVMGLGVLHHLEDQEALDFFRIAREALAPEGRVVTSDPCFSPDQRRISKFLVSRDRGCHVRDPAGYSDLAKNFFRTIRGRVTHQTWIPYTRWRMECSA